MYVGDNPYHDVQGAARTGYETVWVATTGPWRYGEFRADFDIENISQLEGILPDIEKDMEEKDKKRGEKSKIILTNKDRSGIITERSKDSRWSDP